MRSLYDINKYRTTVPYILFISCQFVPGVAREWDAPSGYNHNTSKTSADRFLPEPFIPEEGVRGR